MPKNNKNWENSSSAASRRYLQRAFSGCTLASNHLAVDDHRRVKLAVDAGERVAGVEIVMRSPSPSLTASRPNGGAIALLHPS